MSVSEDLDAIDVYFRAHANDLGAAPQYASWRAWFDDLGWLDRISDSTLANAKKRRDILNTAMGIPSLTEQGMNPVELRPDTMTAETIAKTFAGGGAPPTIKKGSRGEPVRYIQKYLHITEDGNFGSGTDAAVRKFQSEHALTSDGVVGPATWAMMGVKTAIDLTTSKSTLPGVEAGRSVPLPSSGSPAAPKPTFTVTSPKPSPTAPNVVTVAPVAKPAPLQAGIMGSFDSLSTPVKIAGGLAIAAVVAAAIADDKKRKKGH